jgi:hypothetical protein
MNRSISASVSCGASSGRKCPQSIARPVGHAVKHLADHGARSPQSENRCINLAYAVGAIVFKINSAGSAIILARRMNGARICESAHIGVDCLRVEGREIGFGAADPTENVEWHLAGQHILGQRRWLQHHEPVIIRGGEGEIGAFEHLERRRHVEYGQSAHAGFVVTCESMRDTRTTIVTDEMEGLVSKRSHQLDHVEAHDALGIVRMVGQTLRLGAVAIPTEIGAYHAVALRQLRRDSMPADMRFGITM